MNAFWIFLGGGLGSVARWWCAEWMARQLGTAFPWGTLLVNVLGSGIIGFVAVLTAPDGRWFEASTARTFVMVGLCGGYTTFSSFSLQTLALLRGGAWLAAGANVLLSVVLCLVAVWVGGWVASVSFPFRGN